MSWFSRLLIKKLSIGPAFDGPKYWDRRARKYGARSVLNLSHSQRDFERVTIDQRNTLFPLLKAQLKGTESSVLDFGCGPGRFTSDLARLINGTAVGLDVSGELIGLAPKDPCVAYRKITKIAKCEIREKYDLIWVCLVLGGIPESELHHHIKFIQSSLNPGGLLFLVENTSKRNNQEHWAYRTPVEYKVMFDSISLKTIGTYEDLGEEITILAGRLHGN